ncbi:hypothetical protein [Mycolicibacterium sp. 120270]|uniref:hypothetical protein n=1 Tax=Mycolicibacterium sp. 120270 TaxID=3090600 RepID=UPI00299DCC23|nr:hypothetical protein [Mycolicibacterium sp. 120270]MDX1885820.1 hypothetical protein [Mycolicibacterium sp. 120270]
MGNFSERGQNDEVSNLAKLFSQTAFLGDRSNFSHAHYGYLMACMGQIDLMSKCEWGPVEPPRNQTPRMLAFMENYLDAQKVDEHRVAIQLMRHTLMHTGALRFLYEPKTGTAYTWRIHFGDTFPSARFGHYSLSTEDPAYQHDLLSSVSGKVSVVKALNLQITQLAADILRVAKDYTTKMNTNRALQIKCEGAYPAIRVQTLK